MMVLVEYRTPEGTEDSITVPHSDPEYILHYLSGFMTDIHIKRMKVMK